MKESRRSAPSLRVAAAPLLAVIALLSACGGDGDGAATTTPAPSPVLTRAATGTAVSPAASPKSAATPSGTTPASSAASPGAPDPITAAAGVPICDLAIPDAAPGTVASPDLLEISGLAASSTQDVVWAHNDSGDTARVFAIGFDGSALATYTLNGAQAIDWEDMAIGPGPDDGVHYLYLGDIGDNVAARPQVTVYRAPEPTIDPASSSLSLDAVAITLTYPDGAHDAETLLVDPVTGDLFIVTKDISGGPSGLYRAAAADLSGAGTITLERSATINFAALTPARVIPQGSPALPAALPKVPTGGDISPDGGAIAIRTYGTVWIWQRPPGSTVTDAFAALPCEGPSAIEPQGEAIAFDASGTGYFTASEGATPPLHEFRP